MRVEEVSVADHLPNVLSLLRENWDETGFDFELAPDAALYARMQSAGLMFAVAAFEGDAVIGYSTAYLTRHPFNPALVVCGTDALFVAREHRGGSAGARLIAETERVARERGAHRICWHTRAGTTLADVLTKRPGYRAVDVVVERDLTQEIH